MNAAWILIPTWLSLFVLDNYLTVYVARLYESQDPRVIEFEGGYELTPQYKQEIRDLRLFGPRFVRSAIITTFFLVVVWLVVRLGLTFPAVYEVVMGAVILLACVVNLRHLQNITFFRVSDDAEKPQGEIFYPYAMIYRASAIAFLAYAGFFVLLGILMNSWFNFGGALSCSATAFQHYRLSQRRPNTLES